jgi:hypothetical protein
MSTSPVVQPPLVNGTLPWRGKILGARGNAARWGAQAIARAVPAFRWQMAQKTAEYYGIPAPEVAGGILVR